MKITIETIPHSEQRYPTVGDWQFLGDDLLIRVSNMEDWKKEALVGIHELVEALLCKSRGITQEEVDKFDMAYTGEDMDPGNNYSSPYFPQHHMACLVEKLFQELLAVDEEDYEAAIDLLYNSKSAKRAN